MSDQLGEGGKSVVELGKLKKRLEMEKEELQTAVEVPNGRNGAGFCKEPDTPILVVL